VVVVVAVREPVLRHGKLTALSSLCVLFLNFSTIRPLSFHTAKYVKEKTYTLCGTPLYIAPEVVLNRGHDKGGDHWSLGIMIFEMISGYTPFYKDGMDQISLFRAIVKGNFKYPRSRRELFSDQSKDLINRLLVIDPTQRLGSLARGEKDIYRCAWFEDISFDKLKRKEIPSPWIPKIKDPLDTSNFENWDHLDDKAKAKDPPISKKDDDIFKSF
jgi:protein kinase A